MRFARIDLNQPVIVKAFRDLGYAVLHTHTLKNCFDILVSKNGHAFCIEIKNGKGGLTDGEEEFHDTFRAQVHIIRTIDDVIAFDLWARKLAPIAIR